MSGPKNRAPEGAPSYSTSQSGVQTTVHHQASSVAVRQSTYDTIRRGRERRKNGEANRPMDEAETRAYRAWLREIRSDVLHMTEWQTRGFIGFGPPDDRREGVPTFDDPTVAEAEWSNFADYWLNPPYGGERDGDWEDGVWRPIPSMREDMRVWTAELLAVEALTDNSTTAGCLKHGLEQSTGDRGDGLTGLEDAFYAARSMLTRVR